MVNQEVRIYFGIGVRGEDESLVMNSQRVRGKDTASCKNWSWHRADFANVHAIKNACFPPFSIG